MSFSINLKKNEQGTYDLQTTDPQYNPDEIFIGGHVDESGQVVDLTARVPGLYTSASRR